MILPDTPPRYDPQVERERSRRIEAALRQAHTRNADVEIGSARLILTDTDTGDRYSLTVASGVLTLVAL